MYMAKAAKVDQEIWFKHMATLKWYMKPVFCLVSISGKGDIYVYIESDNILNAGG